LGRPSARSLRPVVEQCWTLVGLRRGRIWLARRIDHRRGEPSSVNFDGLVVLDREERKRDVIGFFHTHPSGPPLPSRRDVRTMRAWCSAFGKPLLCVIASPAGKAGYRFDDDTSRGTLLAEVQLFPRGAIVGVDKDG
jgi:proteasome lid subunit RPN8/RPN11